jgi:crossover junction endodeoxyribonuclease RuvC
LAARLKTLLTGLSEVLHTYQPEQVAIEKVFVNVNPQSTLLLGQARGVAIAAVVLRDILPGEYTALQIKQAVVGHGHAAKEQVQDMVVRLLSLGGTPQSDAADALACAICHSHYVGHGLRQYVEQGYRIRHGRLV